MTHTGTEQPEALRIANLLEQCALNSLLSPFMEVANELRRLAELESQLSAIGAGGVEPLRKQSSQQAVQTAVPVGTKFFSFDPCDDLVLHDTAETACAAAQQSIDLYREYAAEGWDEEVERVCWGMILGQALETKLSEDLPPDAFAAGVAGSLPPVDYVLHAPAPPAEGVPAPAAVAVPDSHTQALKAIAEWPVTDMLLNMDAANMRGIAQRALAATQPAAQGVNAPNEWEDIRTLPTCDDLIWLYCQDTNTIDGPIAPEPSLEQYGWTHWAYANAPSTAMLSAAPKPPELKSNSPEFDGIKSALTDEVIDEIAESMPDGIQGFMKIWGWRQFARAIEAALAAKAKHGGA